MYLMYQYFQCLVLQTCDYDGQEAIMSILSTIHAGCQICEKNVAWEIEKYFLFKLLGSDYKNVSFSDHLEHYLNPSWTEQNSFCMDGISAFESAEAYVHEGLCFILNSKKTFFSQR